MEWKTSPHVILTSDTDWDTGVLDYTKSEHDAWFDTVSYSSKLESHGNFDMYRDYFDQTIFQDNELYYFEANTYDEDYDFIIDSCIIHAARLSYHEKNILSYKLVQISKRGVQPKESE